MTNEVKAYYRELEKQSIARKITKRYINGKIIVSAYTENLFNSHRSSMPATMTLGDFAQIMSNANPNKEGIGQKAQIAILQKYLPKFEKLASGGKSSVHFYNDAGKLTFKQGSKKSIQPNIIGVKSFDGCLPASNKKPKIYAALKTTDIGDGSDNEGGGHQENAFNEMLLIVQAMQNHPLKDKGDHIAIIMDGRVNTAIAKLQTYAKNQSNLFIGTTESFVDYYKAL